LFPVDMCSLTSPSMHLKRPRPGRHMPIFL
jgi:hypothetical protein